MAETATKALARYAISRSLDQLPAPVVQRVKWLILDHLGCPLGGSRTPLAAIAVEVAVSMAGPATLVGRAQRVALGPAAFANAAAANALDYDDTGWYPGHPGATIIAAAL